MGLGLFTTSKKGKGILPACPLVDELKTRHWPHVISRALPKVVAASWSAYEDFVKKIKTPDAGTPTGRLSRYLWSIGFFSTPAYFVREWFLATVYEEARWRRGGNPMKWAAWHPRHKVWTALGQEAAFAYCGDATRFDALIKEVLR